LIGGGDRLPLRDRGLIGDTTSAALVAADGTIDWWCPRRFDADATFFRLLDPEGSASRVGPAGKPHAGVQSYDERTNVLRTVLPAPEGELEVTDLMPWRPDLSPDGRIVRLIEARRGRVDVEIDVVPGHRWREARDRSSWSEGVAFDGTLVRSARGMSFRLEAGERAVVTIDPTDDLEPLSVDAALDLLDRTTTTWRSHVAPMTYDGPYRDDVERSLLVLKALTYGPSGTIVAAPTTSLPEKIGGERNWDYRYAWVRDAAMAIDAVYDAGLTEDADRFARWLGTILAEKQFPLRPMYDVDGGELEGEEELTWLGGWRRSQPVRIGNLATEQLQLDFYADVVEAVHLEQLQMDTSLVDLWDELEAMTDWLADAWRRPDSGIWEVRSEPKHIVSSKVACWHALARMSKLARGRNPLDLKAIEWKLAADEVLAWIEEHGLDRSQACVHDPGARDMFDAALLRVAWQGPWPADHPSVVNTVDRVLDQLSSGPFVHRYAPQVDDGLPPGEGAFLACSFWAVRALAALGRWDEAHERMEALCGFGRPLGLLPEEADPQTLEFLGNMPQALSHLSLIHAALALERIPR
jgi:GH15 family glucan-1,4-alpha-glucosidase